MRFLKLIEFEQNYFIYDVESFNLYNIDENLYQSVKNNEVSIEELIPHSKDAESNSNLKNLTNIHLNVAQVCNLVCGYCYGIDGEYGLKGKMNKGNALNAIEYLIKNSGNEKILKVVFFGGEPLLNMPMIEEVVSFCKAKELEVPKKFKFAIVTNGTKFDDVVNDFLNINNFEVTVSFDGDKDTQDVNRPFRGGKGSYESILPKVKKFLESRNGNATARATITNHSKELLYYRDNLKKIGFKNSFVEAVTLSDFSKENYNVNDLTEDQRKQLLEYDKKELEEFTKAIKQRESLEEFLGSKYVVYLKQFINKVKNNQYCGVSRNMRGIAVNGDIYPCHRFVGNSDFKIGKVDSSNDEKNEKKYDVDFINDHPQCKGCFAKYYCGGGGCIHNNYVKNGSITELDQEHCLKMHHKIKSLFSFYNSLDTSDREYLINKINLK
ncbi:radical SAM protein [Flavobacterium sp.]|uniref:radical SAM/SPASM domain-containing protein n=1 Tax=Flavobacterium sp. TaxID=239 RepID=UPI0026202C4C|nr:radical SAM protein [Flavobacterium sp.]MDD2984759.1 SPASM domain-containing protein [Flavobacterium sp.]